MGSVLSLASCSTPAAPLPPLTAGENEKQGVLYRCMTACVRPHVEIIHLICSSCMMQCLSGSESYEIYDRSNRITK